MTHKNHKAESLRPNTEKHLRALTDKLLSALIAVTPNESPFKIMDEDIKEFSRIGIMSLAEDTFSDEEMAEIENFYTKYENKFWLFYWELLSSLDYGVAFTGLNNEKHAAKPDLANFDPASRFKEE